MSPPILVNFGLRGAPPQAYMHTAPGKKEKLGQQPIQISPGKKTSRRGLAGQSELGAAASLNAVWRDLRLASLLMHLCFPLVTVL